MTGEDVVKILLVACSNILFFWLGAIYGMRKGMKIVSEGINEAVEATKLLIEARKRLFKGDNEG